MSIDTHSQKRLQTTQKVTVVGAGVNALLGLFKIIIRPTQKAVESSKSPHSGSRNLDRVGGPLLEIYTIALCANIFIANFANLKSKSM